MFLVFSQWFDGTFYKNKEDEDSKSRGQKLYFCDMEINDEMIDKLAGLSRLRFSAEEKTELKSDLRKMLQFVDKLNELDTSGTDPLLHITDNVSVLRDDIVHSDFTREQALFNASVKDEAFFKVPKVIKK
jgi:aspartyl-tRNA(Asn)/glutamyl-tRNA(Gln) amidotransferase subunit C